MTAMHIELEGVIRRLVDFGVESLTSDEMATLQRSLVEDRASRTLYLEYVATHAALCLKHTRPLAIQLTPPSTPRPLPRPQVRRWSAATALAAAMVLLAGALVVVYLTGEPGAEPKSGGSERAGPPVATLIDATGDVYVNDDPTSAGAEITSGELSLATGSAEFQLDSGVNIRLSGPSRMSILDPMRTRLVRGAASVDCPPSARGFEVIVPGGRVIDHGTAFDIEVDASGSTRVWVTEGRVSLTSAASSPPLSLIAGAFGVIEPDGRLALAIDPPTPSVHLPLRTTDPTDGHGEHPGPIASTIDRLGSPVATIDPSTVGADRAMTVSLWFRRHRADRDPNTVYLVVAGNHFSYRPGWSMFIGSGAVADGGRVGVRLSTPPHVAAQTGPAIDDARWHHIALVIDADAGRIRGYLDGCADGWTGGGGGGHTDRLPELASLRDGPPIEVGLIADNVGAAAPPVPIELYNLRIYHTALSPLQVRALHASDPPPDSPP